MPFLFILRTLLLDYTSVPGTQLLSLCFLGVLERGLDNRGLDSGKLSKYWKCGLKMWCRLFLWHKCTEHQKWWRAGLTWTRVDRYWSESWKWQDFQRLVARKLVFTAVCSISASYFLKIKHLGKTEAAQRINVGEFASLILLNPPSLRSNKSYKEFHLGPLKCLEPNIFYISNVYDLTKMEHAFLTPPGGLEWHLAITRLMFMQQSVYIATQS